MSHELTHRIAKIYKWVNLLEPCKSLNLVDLVKIEIVLRCGRYEQRLRWFAVLKFGEEYSGKNSTGIHVSSKTKCCNFCCQQKAAYHKKEVKLKMSHVPNLEGSLYVIYRGALAVMVVREFTPIKNSQ